MRQNCPPWERPWGRIFFQIRKKLEVVIWPTRWILIIHNSGPHFLMQWFMHGVLYFAGVWCGTTQEWGFLAPDKVCWSSHMSHDSHVTKICPFSCRDGGLPPLAGASPKFNKLLQVSDGGLFISVSAMSSPSLPRWWFVPIPQRGPLRLSCWQSFVPLRKSQRYTQLAGHPMQWAPSMWRIAYIGHFLETQKALKWGSPMQPHRGERAQSTCTFPQKTASLQCVPAASSRVPFWNDYTIVCSPANLSGQRPVSPPATCSHDTAHTQTLATDCTMCAWQLASLALWRAGKLAL